MTRSRRFFASSPWIATGTPDYVNLGYTSRGLAKQALMRLSRKSLAIFRKLGLGHAQTQVNGCRDEGMRDPNPMFRPYARGWTSKPWKSYLSDLRIRTLPDSARSTPRSCIGSAKRQGACTSTVCSSPVLGVNRLRRYRPPIDPESRQCSIG